MSDFTEADLTAINKAIKTGALKVKYTDKEIQYSSLEEMLRIRDQIRRDLGLNNSTQRVPMKFGKGL